MVANEVIIIKLINKDVTACHICYTIFNKKKHFFFNQYLNRVLSFYKPVWPICTTIIIANVNKCNSLRYVTRILMFRSETAVILLLHPYNNHATVRHSDSVNWAVTHTSKGQLIQMEIREGSKRIICISNESCVNVRVYCPKIGVTIL